MLCYICGRICDKNAHGLCIECLREMAINNERVMILSLLNEAQMFCPIRLQDKIEEVLDALNITLRRQLPLYVKEKSP